MNVLFLDTETTGLPLWKEPSHHPGQPHIVQLAALMVNVDTRKTVATIDLTIRPEGWTIPDETAAIHGVTTEHALDVGVPESMALRLFIEMWTRCAFRVAHNAPFDARILRIALTRHLPDLADSYKAGAEQCTQALSTPVLNLPPSEKMRAVGRTHAKSANLREAYEFFMGKPLEGAHTALADAQACRDVWLAINAPRPCPIPLEGESWTK